MTAEPITSDDEFNSEHCSREDGMFGKEKRKEGICVTYVKSLYYEDPDPQVDVPEDALAAERLGDEDRFIVSAKARAVLLGDTTASIFPARGLDKEFDAKIGMHIMSLTARHRPTPPASEPPPPVE